MTIDDFEAMVRIKMVEKAAMEEVGTKQALKVEIQSESWKQTYFLTFVQCKLFLCTVCFSPTWQLIDLFCSNGHRWILKYLSMVVVSMSECFHSNISFCSNVLVLKSKKLIVPISKVEICFSQVICLTIENQAIPESIVPMLQWLAKLESTFCNGHHKACPSYHFLATLGGPLHSIERSLVPPRHLIHVTSWTNIYSKSKSIKYLQHQANKLHKECHNNPWYMNEEKHPIGFCIESKWF